MHLRTHLFAVALGLSAPAAFAGDQFVDTNGYAVSGYDVVAYFGLEQAPIGEDQPGAIPGKSSITADWNGAKWAFSSEENRDKFLATPEAFAPQYDGHCAFGVAQGGKVPGNPDLWRIVDDKLYVNITKNVVGFWTEDIPGNLVKSESNWPGIEPDPASVIAIPDFMSSAPES